MKSLLEKQFQIEINLCDSESGKKRNTLTYLANIPITKKCEDFLRTKFLKYLSIYSDCVLNAATCSVIE